MSSFKDQKTAVNKSNFYSLKKFFSFYKPYRLLFAGDVFCASTHALIALMLPLCIRHITNEVLSNGSADPWPLVFRTLIVMLSLIIIQTICGLFYDYKGHAMGAMIERDMRNDLFNKMQRLPVSFFDRQKTGALMARITSDLWNLAETCHHLPENILIYLVSFIGGFIVLFKIDIRLTLVIFAMMPVMVLYTIYFQRILRVVYRENREKIGELNASLEDTLAGIRVAKSFANEELEMEKFRKANNVYCRGRTNIYRTEAHYYTVMTDLFVPLVTAGVITAGSMLISGSRLSTSDLIVFLLYIGYLTKPLTNIASTVGMYQDGIAGFSRFLEIMDMEPEKTGSVSLPEKKYSGHIEFSNVSFSYGENLENVFKNVSLNIKPGESIALMGASGAGKTTLCSLIPRFYEPSSGRILLDGEDIQKMDLGTLRRNIGLIAQDVYLFNGTVAENIVYGKPGASREEIINAAILAKADDFIMDLPKGYETEIGQRGIRLSGGQRQRLSIARAFLKDPPILILDEATSALDYENEKAIHESLDYFMKDRTVLIIAHRLSTVRKAKRVFSLSAGSIEETPLEGDNA